MRVLILSLTYPPEPNFRLRDLAAYLQAHGHAVAAVTTFPSYPVGQVYPGYRMVPLGHSVEAGVRVTRVYSLIYRGLGRGRRLLSYVSFCGAALVLGLLPRRRPDVLYVMHPPLTTGLAAALYNLLAGVPFVYDVQDLWPEAIVAAGLLREGSRAYRAIRRLEDFVYARAAQITVLSAGQRRNLLGKGVPAAKIHIVPNWGDAAIYRPDDAGDVRAAEGWGARFVVLLAGNMGLTHGLETVLDTADLLRADPGLLFVFLGAGAAKPALQAAATRRALPNVVFHDQVPEATAVQFINAADVLLVHLKPAGGDFSVPHRIFSYLLCGKPVIVAAGGAGAELIESLGCGWVSPPGDPVALQAVLTAARDRPDEARARGRRGLAVAQGAYSRPALLEQMAAATRPATLALKRLFDCAVALTLLIALAPLCALIALAVRRRLGAPVLFRQQRPGRHGRPFLMFKFRTMTDAHDAAGRLLADTERLTPLGRALRATSLDELPELINVLRGEMSLVGPRPLLMRYTPYFTPEERLRFAVRPGITGLAQVSGRNTLSWDGRIAADLTYVRNLSLALDLRILLTTISRLVTRHGLQPDPVAAATMLNFDDERRLRQTRAQEEGGAR